MKQLEKVFLLLNGEAPNQLPDLSEYTIVCATDGAYHVLNDFGVKPNFVSGDFDSSIEIPKDIERIHTPDQNFTDFDKILSLLDQRGLAKIDIYGASGKEQDHFLGNLHTALKWKDRLKITFFDNHGSYFFSEKATLLKQVQGKTISLVPFPEANNITATGLEFSLKNETLSFKNRIGTRNKAVDNDVSIQYQAGELLLFILD